MIPVFSLLAMHAFGKCIRALPISAGIAFSLLLIFHFF